jgi:hypothetical protein
VGSTGSVVCLLADCDMRNEGDVEAPLISIVHPNQRIAGHIQKVTVFVGGGWYKKILLPRRLRWLLCQQLRSARGRIGEISHKQKLGAFRQTCLNEKKTYIARKP